MALKIKPKRSSTASNVPDTSNLDAGEIAINLADKKLFVRDTSNNILELTTRTLNSLDNVNISGLTNNQTLQYNSTSSKWENSTSGSSSWTTGSGLIYNTGTVGIGTATPSTTYKLDVDGKINTSGGFYVDGTLVPVSDPFHTAQETVVEDYVVVTGYTADNVKIIQIASGVTVSVQDFSSLVIKVEALNQLTASPYSISQTTVSHNYIIPEGYDASANDTSGISTGVTITTETDATLSIG